MADWDVSKLQAETGTCMEPIIKLAMTDLSAQLEGTIMQYVQHIHVDVDKERLIQALTDARKFYDEGYRAGYKACREEELSWESSVYKPMRSDCDD